MNGGTRHLMKGGARRFGQSGSLEKNLFLGQGERVGCVHAARAIRFQEKSWEQTEIFG